jgi:hypothetical protein
MDHSTQMMNDMVKVLGRDKSENLQIGLFSEVEFGLKP